MTVLVDLNAFDLQPIGAALILHGPTGVTYVHQAGGTACLQKRYEGAYVPLPGLDLSETDEGVRLQDWADLQEYGRPEAAAALCAAHVPVFEPGTTVAARVGSCEAWLVGRVRTGDKPWKTLPAGLDCPAVLLWDNSD